MQRSLERDALHGSKSETNEMKGKVNQMKKHEPAPYIARPINSCNDGFSSDLSYKETVKLARERATLENVPYIVKSPLFNQFGDFIGYTDGRKINP